MSKTYIGVDGVARPIKGGYIGVDNVARKVKKIYIGVGGVAELCFDNRDEPVPETQTLTVINRNNESETSTFTMPKGYQFIQLINSSEYNTGGAFSVGNDRTIVRYNDIPLEYSDGSNAYQDYLASGTFYYEGTAKKITDLTGTIWYFNDHIDISAIAPTLPPSYYYDITGATFMGIYPYALNFESGSYMYKSIGFNSTNDIDWNQFLYQAEIATFGYQAYLGDWASQECRTIRIIDGADATNPDLIAWIQANAIRVPALSGTWTFNARIEPPLDGIEASAGISFTSNGEDYDSMIRMYWDDLPREEEGENNLRYGGPGKDVFVCNGALGAEFADTWLDLAYCTVDFGDVPQEVPQSFLDWFVRNTLRKEGNIIFIMTVSESVFTVRQAEPGMTWSEWCDSIYNYDGWYVSGDMIRRVTDHIHNVVASDIIEEEGVYWIAVGGDSN